MNVDFVYYSFAAQKSRLTCSFSRRLIDTARETTSRYGVVVADLPEKKGDQTGGGETHAR